MTDNQLHPWPKLSTKIVFFEFSGLALGGLAMFYGLSLAIQDCCGLYPANRVIDPKAIEATPVSAPVEPIADGSPVR